MKNLSTNTAEFSSIKAGDGNGLHLQDDGGNGIFIKDGGNVGIGTTSPVHRLEVAIPDAKYSIHAVDENDYTSLGGLYRAAEGDGGGLELYLKQSGETKIRLSSNSSRSTYFNGGNVGIGTTNPVYKFHVADTSAANLLIQRRTAGGQVDGITLNSIAGTGINNRTGDISLIMTTAAGDAEPALRFSTTNGASATKHAMHISNGRVGIGTTNPSTTFNVVANHGAGDGAAFFKNESTDFGMGVKIEAGGNTDTERYALRVDNAAGDTLLFCQSKTSYVGIGTTNPTYKFHLVENRQGNFAAEIENLSTGTTGATAPYGVYIKYPSASPNALNGDFLRCADSTAIRLRIYSNGDIQNYNNSYSQLSDIKLKENVADATPKLDDLNKVRVVNFNFKGDNLKQIGVVAQELEEIFPGLVQDVPDYDEDNNLLETTTKSVKYSVFGPILIKAIQEQQQIIEDLKSQNESLAARITALEG